MKKVIAMYKITPTIIFSIVFMICLSISSHAQCVACFQSIENGEPTCSTGLVLRDGSVSCGCDTGCHCSGSCQYGPPHQLESSSYSKSKLDYNKIKIPSKGFKLFVPGNKNFIKQSNLKSAFLGNKKSSKVFIGDHFGAYQASENIYIIYPLYKHSNSFKIRNCSNDIIGIATRKPVNTSKNMASLDR